jgi:hypothetical protein
MIELPSPNQDDRPGPVDMLILHYTGMQSAQAALARLCDPVAKVSSHYVVDEDGTIYRLVPERRRAYHAGLSFWRGRRALNDVSVGIEIVNPGHEFGYRAFPAARCWTCASASCGRTTFRRATWSATAMWRRTESRTRVSCFRGASWQRMVWGFGRMSTVPLRGRLASRQDPCCKISVTIPICL